MVSKEEFLNCQCPHFQIQNKEFQHLLTLKLNSAFKELQNALFQNEIMKEIKRKSLRESRGQFISCSFPQFFDQVSNYLISIDLQRKMRNWVENYQREISRHKLVRGEEGVSLHFHSTLLEMCPQSLKGKFILSVQKFSNHKICGPLHFLLRFFCINPILFVFS